MRDDWTDVVDLIERVVGEEDLLPSVVAGVRAIVREVAVLPAADIAGHTPALLFAATRALAARRGPTEAELSFVEDLGVTRARQGVPVEAVLAAIHVAERAIWSRARESVTTGEIDAALLLDARELYGDWAEAVRTRLIRAHRAADTRQQTGPADRDLMVLRRLLEGGTAATLAAAEAGLPVSGLWILVARPGNGGLARALRADARALAGHIDGVLVAVLTRQPSAHVVAALGSLPVVPGVGPEVTGLLTAVPGSGQGATNSPVAVPGSTRAATNSPAAVPGSARAGAGSPAAVPDTIGTTQTPPAAGADPAGPVRRASGGPGVAGLAGPADPEELAATRKLAVAALTAAEATGLAGLVHVADVAVLAATADRGDLAGVLQERYRPARITLGPNVEPVARAVRTWLEAGRDTTASADRLFVHPNTVRNRVQRFTEVTGIDPFDTFGAVNAWWLCTGWLADAESARPRSTPESPGRKTRSPA